MAHDSKNADNNKDEEEQISKEAMDQIERGFDLQAKRLNDFITMSSAKIESMRFRAQDTGFFHHEFCFFCGN
jgi:hypothetical protein